MDEPTKNARTFAAHSPAILDQLDPVQQSCFPYTLTARSGMSNDYLQTVKWGILLNGSSFSGEQHQQAAADCQSNYASIIC